MSFSKTTMALVALALLVLSFMWGRACSPEQSVVSRDGRSPVTQPATWTCSMHPQVRLPKPGKCPICFMDLVPANSQDAEAEDGPRVLRMSKNAMALAEIETAKVERCVVAHEVQMTGKIALDETRMAYITSWVSGRLDRLFVDYTGVNVRAGDHLVEIYSPTLYSAQQELLQAIATAKRLEGSSLDILRSTSDQTVISAREKLRLYGLSVPQIQKIVDQGIPDERITIYAPIGGVVVHKNALEGMYVEEGTRIYTIADLTTVWVLFDAYESDLAWLRYGQEVEFSVEAFPGETFHSRIAFIDPLLDDHTRTVKVRLSVENADLRLKPDMFVSAKAHAVLTEHGKVVDEDLAGKWMCPMHPEIVADALESCSECGMDLVQSEELGFVVQPELGESLVIPASAPLITGRRAVVYVRLPDRNEPTFEGRVITLGPRAGNWYVVRDGLAEGDSVVVKGNFKLDSELQIRAKPSMMSLDPDASDPAPSLEVPEEFRAQLGNAVEEYLRMQESFSRDQHHLWDIKFGNPPVFKLDASMLSGAARTAWEELRPELLMASEEFGRASDLEVSRKFLSPLSELLIRALKTFGYTRKGGNLRVFHCPMALDGEGANWIQVSETTANPYFGSAMLRCGSQIEVLKQGN